MELDAVVQNTSTPRALTRRPPRVLLTDTTHWALGARLAIALAQVGCLVSAVCASGAKPLRKTKALQRVFRYRPLRPLQSLVAAIAEADPDYIVPCDDRAVLHLHELYQEAIASGGAGDKLRALLELSLGLPASHHVVSRRYELLEIAREEGLLVPKSVPLKSLQDVPSQLTKDVYPWVLKADGTWGGGGVKIARNRVEAERCFQELTQLFRPQRAWKRLFVNRDGFLLRSALGRTRPTLSAQSYIDGRPANCAVFCSQGKILAGIAVEVVHSQGATGPATIVQVVRGDAMMHAAKRLASRLGLSGFFGLDFVIEEGSNAAYLIEMNPRCTPLCHLRLGTGRDMAAALWAHLSDRAIPETQPETQCERIAYFPDAKNHPADKMDLIYLDLPRNEPELIKELLNPWPDRSLIYRAFTYLQGLEVASPAQSRSNIPAES